MLNPELKGRFEVTEKVTAPKFRHVLFGLVDLAKISEPLAEKLVKKGYLKLVKEEEKPKKVKIEKTES